ncbi:hypothetical protein [Mycetocola miduiensis]|uniref:DNA polymerase III beta subunit, central domain n=1 Tax=Mycetocola miduiensis TaxID=995034 RepID=A0A1I5AX14_9MICO|nr:hypothetical protein [Mycetocola miduiensis]SFN66985.1 DNA polymerase III beta subunit, central domain [Mycetocola miduiensis]
MSTTDTTAPVQKPRGSATKFTVPAVLLRDLVAGILPATSKDDVTPVLCAAQWIIEDSVLRLVGTDRYRIHTATVALPGKPKAGHFIVPRSALIWIWKNANFYGRARSNATIPVVDIELTVPANADSANPGTITVKVRRSVDERLHVLSFADKLVVGIFPPVMKLVEKARAAEIASATAKVNLRFVADAQKMAGNGYVAPRIKFTAAEDGSSKPGVVLVAFENDDKTPYAEALIQPNLELR